MTPHAAESSARDLSALYVSQPTKQVESAKAHMVKLVSIHGKVAARKLLDETRSQAGVGESVAREAMSRLMSSGIIRLSSDWNVEVVS